MANREKALQVAYDFIKSKEGLYSAVKGGYVAVRKDAPPSTPIYAYWDKFGKVWTIGWGSIYRRDGSKVQENDVITKAEADKRIEEEADKWEKYISTKIDSTKLNENQYAALISIAYNAGGGGLMKSRIATAIKNNLPKEEVAKVISDSLVTAKGVFVQGLANRRRAEAQLYLTPVLPTSSGNKGKNVALYIGIAIVSVGASLYLYNKLSA